MASSYVHPVMDDLYAEHHSWVVQLLRRKLGGQEQALDLAQDTFVRILINGRVPVFHEPRAYLAFIAGRSEVSARGISMYQKQQNPRWAGFVDALNCRGNLNWILRCLI